MKLIQKKKEFLLVLILLVISAALWSINQIRTWKPGNIVEISVDGTVIRTLELSTDEMMEIQGYNHGNNQMIVKDGKVWLDHASCPDQLCIKTGQIHRNGDVIVCLPNRVIIRIIGE